MSKVVRLNSKESGPFTTSNNIVHMTIPQGMVVDMADSSVEVEMQVTTDTKAIHNVEVKYNSADVPLFNSCLIKNSRVAGQMVGQLEEINRVDLLQGSLKHYEMGRAQKNSIQYNSLYQLYNPRQQKLSPFRNYISNGTVISSEQKARFKIPLSELSGIGEVINLDTNKTGDLTYRLELNTDKLAANTFGDAYELCDDLPTGAQNDIRITQAYPGGNAPFYVGQVISIHGQNSGAGASMFNQLRTIITIGYNNLGIATIALNNPLPDAGAGNTYQNVFCYGGTQCADIPQNTVATNTLTLQNFKNIDFWVGCQVRISANPTGGALLDTVVFRNVTGINYDNATGVATVTVDGAAILGTGAGESYSSIFMTIDVRGSYTLNQPAAHNPVAASLSFDQVDLVAVMANPEIPVPDEYRYSTYVLERHSGANVSNFNQAFSLEPMCDGVMMTFSPDSNETPYSVNDVITDYRLRLNNVNLSQRNVIIDNPLYYDDILKFMTNDGRNLKNLLRIPSVTNANLVNAQQNGQRNVIVCLPAPLSVQNKILQVNINCSTAGVNIVNLFKSVQKSL